MNDAIATAKERAIKHAIGMDKVLSARKKRKIVRDNLRITTQRIAFLDEQTGEKKEKVRVTKHFMYNRRIRRSTF